MAPYWFLTQRSILDGADALQLAELVRGNDLPHCAGKPAHHHAVRAGAVFKISYPLCRKSPVVMPVAAKNILSDAIRSFMSNGLLISIPISFVQVDLALVAGVKFAHNLTPHAAQPYRRQHAFWGAADAH